MIANNNYEAQRSKIIQCFTKKRGKIREKPENVAAVFFFPLSLIIS